MTHTRQHNPELIRNALFARCKLLWGAGLIVKLVMFFLGIAVVLSPVGTKILGIIGLILVVVAEYLLWQSDRWKGAVHGLHRKLDFENSFGWYITESELMDYLARFPGNIEELVGKTTGSYFASETPPGPKRALENLRESAWWSMHLSESMFWRATTLIIAIFFGCLFLLNASAGIVPQGEAGVTPDTIKIFTSSILFIFSFGLMKFATGYYSFCSKAKQIKERAEHILNGQEVDEMRAIKLWQDYHLAREAAPIIPTWIWRQREKKLNALWNCYVSAKSPQQ